MQYVRHQKGRSMRCLIINGHEVLIERDPDGWWRCTIDRADHSSTLHQTIERAETYARAVCLSK
jgi:hypothetical protein